MLECVIGPDAALTDAPKSSGPGAAAVAVSCLSVGLLQAQARCQVRGTEEVFELEVAQGFERIEVVTVACSKASSKSNFESQYKWTVIGKACSRV